MTRKESEAQFKRVLEEVEIDEDTAKKIAARIAEIKADDDDDDDDDDDEG